MTAHSVSLAENSFPIASIGGENRVGSPHVEAQMHRESPAIMYDP